MAYLPKKYGALKTSSVGILVNAVVDADTTGYLAGAPRVDETSASLLLAGRFILGQQDRRNAWVNTLMNGIFVKVIQTVSFYDEWERYTEKGILERGEGIEEIYVGLVDPEQYVWTENINDTMKALFGKRQQEISSAYHVINFEKRYPVTIAADELRKAFEGFRQMQEFIKAKIAAVTVSYIYDNYLMNKYQLYRLALDGMIYNVEIPVLTKATAEDAVIAMKRVIKDASHMRAKYTISKLPQTMNPRRAIIAANEDFESVVDVVVLSRAFHLEYSEFAQRQLSLDGFGEDDIARLNIILKEDPTYKPFTEDEIEKINNIAAFVFDEEFFMNYTYLSEWDYAYNGAERYENRFYHIWKTYGISPYKPVMMFSYSGGEVTAVTVSPSTATMAANSSMQMTANVAFTGFVDQGVTWSISGETQKAGVATNPTTIGYYGDLYISPDETAGTAITVTATSIADPTISGTATITVAGAAVQNDTPDNPAEQNVPAEQNDTHDVPVAKKASKKVSL